MFEGQITPSEWRSELLKLEQLTSDPSNPQPGDEWLRVDQKPSYTDANGNTRTAVAQYRRVRQDGTTITVPVAQLGDATDSEVIDKVRANVSAGGSPTGKGFVPFAKTGASYPKRKLQHPVDGEVGLHDALTASAIPDAQNLYADYNPAAQSDAAPFVDQAGSASDLTANGDPTLQSGVFGSNNGIDLDGNGDYYVGASADFGTLSQPYTVYFVFQNDDGTDTGERVLMNAETENEIVWDGRSGKNNWKFRGTNRHTFGKNTPFYNDIASVWDGANSVIEADGTDVLSNVDIGSVDLDGFILGQRRDDTRRWDGRLGRVLVYNTAHDSQTRSDVRSFLSDGGWI